MADLENNIKILIAEDHFATRQILTTTLRADGFSSVDVANNGKVAREMILHADAIGDPYHVIFLDWDMPFIQGIDVLKYFREQPRFANTAFIMVTSMSTQSQVKDAVKTGVTAYMVKPVSVGAVSKKMKEIVTWLKQRWAVG